VRKTAFIASICGIHQLKPCREKVLVQRMVRAVISSYWTFIASCKSCSLWQCWNDTVA